VDAPGGRGLTTGQDAARAERVRDAVRAGGVDDRAREDLLLALRGRDGERERRVVAALGLHLVEPEAGDRGDPVPDAHPVAESAAERGKVRVHELTAGRVGLTIGLGPAGVARREELARGGVDVELPWREDPDLAPLKDRGADRVAGLEDERQGTALQELGGCGEADRSPTDDRDGQFVHEAHDAHLSTLVNIEVCGYSGCMDEIKILQAIAEPTRLAIVSRIAALGHLLSAGAQREPKRVAAKPALARA